MELTFALYVILFSSLMNSVHLLLEEQNEKSNHVLFVLQKYGCLLPGHFLKHKHSNYDAKDLSSCIWRLIQYIHGLSTFFTEMNNIILLYFCQIC